MNTESQIAAHVRGILSLLGEDPTCEGLRDTPHRVARFYMDFLSREVTNTMTTFESGTYHDLVVVKDIRGWSLCEHHLLPFSFVAHVGYIPEGRVLGLSKIPRIVLHHACQLQLQERMTQAIAADVLAAVGHDAGAACIVEGQHTCVSMRGVERDPTMVTHAFLGSLNLPEARREFLSLVR